MKSLFLIITCLYLVSADPGDKIDDCGGKPADVVFVLEASNNIHQKQFKKLQQFIRSVVSEFDISPEKTRVGLITYSDYVQEVVTLRSPYSDKMNLFTAISNLYQLTGKSYTDQALMHAREMIRREGRTNVPRMVVVLTNGWSEFPQLTQDEADTTKKNDITIFSIGIGHRVNREELNKIASQTDYVFNVDNFKALEVIRKVLAIKACGVQADSPYGVNYRYDPYYYQNSIIKESKASKLEKACGGRPAEIVFCLDASGSIWGPDFKRQLTFVSDMTSVFQVEPDMTRIGVLTFGDTPREWFHLNTYKYEEEIKNAITNIYQSRGGTNTADALNNMRTEYFNEKVVRPDVVKIAIVITDGKSANRGLTAMQAAKLRDEGIYVFAIGVGHNLDEKELHLISSQPSKDYVFRVEGYEALESIKNLLSMKTCQVTMPPTTEPPITECGNRRPADVVFAMPPDADAAQAAKIIAMMSKAADELDMGPDAVKMGLVPKECVSLPGLELSGELDTSSLLEKVSDNYAAAHTPRILRYLRRRGFTAENGARKEAQKMAVIILDKSSPNYEQTSAEAAKAKEMGVQIFVIAVGKDITDAELELVASSPTENHVIRVNSYAELPGIASKLVELINKSCIEYIPPEVTDDIEDEIRIKINNKVELTNRYTFS